MINTEKVEDFYLDYFNNYLTIDRIASDYGYSKDKAEALISFGRKINHSRSTTKQTKATKHRKNWRLWLQSCDLMIAAGFEPNARYSIDYGKNSITLTLDENGKRKVSDTARGATLDLNNSKLAPYDFTNGVHWQFSDGVIVIREGR